MDISLVAAAAATVLSWAFAFAGIRAALQSFTPLEVAAIRFYVAATVLVAVWVVRQAPLPRTNWRRVVLLALVGFVLYSLALNAGQVTVRAGAASLLVNTVPVWTALLSAVFLRERLTAYGWAGLLVSFGGAAVIAVGRGDMGGDVWGVALVLAAAILLASYFVMQKPLLLATKAIDLTTWCVAVSAIVMLPVAVALPAKFAAASARSIVAALALGVLPTALAYFTWSYVLARVPVARATSILYVVPVATILIAYVWLGESPSLLTLVGGVLAIGGVVIVNILGRTVSA